MRKSGVQNAHSKSQETVQHCSARDSLFLFRELLETYLLRAPIRLACHHPVC